MKKVVVFLLSAFTLAFFLSVNRSYMADGQPVPAVVVNGADLVSGTSTDSANFIFKDLASEILWSRESGGNNQVRTGKTSDYRIVPDSRFADSRTSAVSDDSFAANGSAFRPAGASANRYHVFALRKIRI